MPHVEEESQKKKRQHRTIADCVVVVSKHSLEILNFVDFESVPLKRIYHESMKVRSHNF